MRTFRFSRHAQSDKMLVVCLCKTDGCGVSGRLDSLATTQSPEKHENCVIPCDVDTLVVARYLSFGDQ